MATGSVLLQPNACEPPDGSATNLAPGMSRVQGTQTGAKWHHVTLDFDGSGTVEGAWWTFRLPANWASASTLKIQWIANATSGAVKWQAQVGAITPADADTPLEHALAAAATVTTNVNATEANRLTESSITITNDAFTVGDLIELFVFRDSADAADTCTVDARMVSMSFEYTTL